MQGCRILLTNKCVATPKHRPDLCSPLLPFLPLSMPFIVTNADVISRPSGSGSSDNNNNEGSSLSLLLNPKASFALRSVTSDGCALSADAPVYSVHASGLFWHKIRQIRIRVAPALCSIVRGAEHGQLVQQQEQEPLRQSYYGGQEGERGDRRFNPQRALGDPSFIVAQKPDSVGKKSLHKS